MVTSSGLFIEQFCWYSINKPCSVKEKLSVVSGKAPNVSVDLEFGCYITFTGKTFIKLSKSQDVRYSMS